MENADVARVLEEMADLLELSDGNAFKVRAYREAAAVVDTLPGPVVELWRQGQLTGLPGIGEKMAAHIGELLQTGAFAEFQRLAQQVPPGVREMLRLQGVGPKTVAQLWKGLGLTTLEEVEAACRDGRILTLPRMGEARARAISRAVESRRGYRGRMLLHRALPYAQSLLGRLRALEEVDRAEVAGSVRRRKETVGDVDLLVASHQPGAVSRAFTSFPDVAQVLAQGPTKSSILLRNGLQVDLRVVPTESFGAALHYFTGSKAHNVALRRRAVKLGLLINEYGIFNREGGRLGGEEEEEVFRAVGLPFIAPELREGAGELEAAQAGLLPVLLEEPQLRGDLHLHSKEGSSDGRTPLLALAEEARRLGREYLAVTEHSRSRPLGLEGERLEAHVRRVRELDAALGGSPRLLAGIEVDILADGSLDLPLEQLAQLDWVVASIHTRFQDPPEIITERMVRALRSGVVDVLGHPSGRRLGVREPYRFDLSRVLAVAKEEGVALEVNAAPDRLDLDDHACRLVREAGVSVVISSDSHNATALSNLRYGVWVARRGWLGPQQVLNTRPWPELREWRLQRLRRRVAAGVEPFGAHP